MICGQQITYWKSFLEAHSAFKRRLSVVFFSIFSEWKNRMKLLWFVFWIKCICFNLNIKEHFENWFNVFFGKEKSNFSFCLCNHLSFVFCSLSSFFLLLLFSTKHLDGRQCNVDILLIHKVKPCILLEWKIYFTWVKFKIKSINFKISYRILNYQFYVL